MSAFVYTPSTDLIAAFQQADYNSFSLLGSRRFANWLSQLFFRASTVRPSIEAEKIVRVAPYFAFADYRRLYAQDDCPECKLYPSSPHSPIILWTHPSPEHSAQNKRSLITDVLAHQFAKAGILDKDRLAELAHTTMSDFVAQLNEQGEDVLVANPLVNNPGSSDYRVHMRSNRLVMTLMRT